MRADWLFIFQFPRGLTPYACRVSHSLVSVFQFPRGLTNQYGSAKWLRYYQNFQFPRGLTASNISRWEVEARGTFNSLED